MVDCKSKMTPLFILQLSLQYLFFYVISFGSALGVSFLGDSFTTQPTTGAMQPSSGQGWVLSLFMFL